MKLNIAAVCFILAGAARGGAVEIARPEKPVRGIVTPQAAIEHRFPRWGDRMYRFLVSPEGRIVAQFESDYSRPGFFGTEEERKRSQREATPLLDFTARVADPRGGWSVFEKEEAFETSEGRVQLARHFLNEYGLMQAKKFVDDYHRSLGAANNAEYLDAADLRRELKKLTGIMSDIGHFQGTYLNDMSKDLREGSLYTQSLVQDFPLLSRAQSDLTLALAKKEAEQQGLADGPVIETPGVKGRTLRLRAWMAEKVPSVAGKGSASELREVHFEHDKGHVVFRLPAWNATPRVQFLREARNGPSAYESRVYEITPGRAGRIARLLTLLQKAAAQNEKNVVRNKVVKGMIRSLKGLAAGLPAAIGVVGAFVGTAHATSDAFAVLDLPGMLASSLAGFFVSFAVAFCLMALAAWAVSILLRPISDRPGYIGKAAKAVQLSAAAFTRIFRDSLLDMPVLGGLLRLIADARSRSKAPVNPQPKKRKPRLE